MSTDIVHIAQATGYDQGKIQLVKDTIAKGATDDELMLFLQIAKRTGLDPFTRQIYLIERRQEVDGKWITTRQTQTGIDGLRLTADRTDNYAPGRAPTYAYDQDGKLYSATAYVMKFVRGSWLEVAATAHYSEYVQTKRDGNPNKMWAEKPHIMLAKCAEALALRRAFPADLSGLYTADEISEPIEVKPAANPLAPLFDRIEALWKEADELTPDSPIDEQHKTRVRGLTSRDELIDYGKKMRVKIDGMKASRVEAIAIDDGASYEPVEGEVVA